MKIVYSIILSFLFINTFGQCVSGDCVTGDGIYIYSDYTIYIGNFEDGKASGHGTCYYSNGEKYVGRWSNHYFNGEGVLYYADNQIEAGIWEDGRLVENKTSLLPKISTEQPKIWAVIIGVSDYTAMQRLNYPDDDAYKMLAFLKSPEGGAVPDEQLRTLIDDAATKENIIRSMHEMFSKAAPNDVVMFYYSGHGLENSFLPINYDGENNQLFHAEVMNVINSCKAKHKICMIDACHSGGISTSPYNETGLVAMKGSIETVIESYYAAFDNTQGGTAFILSSKPEESSIEHKGFRQGVFTHFLIEGLKGMADMDSDQIVTVGEIFNYVSDNVRSYTSNFQTPVMIGASSAKTPLAVVRN